MYGYTEKRCIGYTPMSIYCFLVLDGRILQDSIVPKQALINAVYKYFCKSFFSVWALLYEVAGWQLPPHYPQRKLLRCKVTTIFARLQILIRNEKTKTGCLTTCIVRQPPYEERLDLPINWHGAKSGFARVFRVCQYSRAEPTCRLSDKFYHNRIYRSRGLTLCPLAVHHSHRACRE